MRRWLLAIIILLSMAIAAIPTNQASAAPNKFIAIIRSDTCERTDCIKVKDLIKYDTSNQKISGILMYNKNTDDYTRKAGMPNGINWYFANAPGKTVVFVEPDQKTLVRSKQIVLFSSLAEFAPPTRLEKRLVDFHNYTRITYHGVYVDDHCGVANVGVKQHPDLTKIILHLESGCKTDLGNKISHNEAKTKLNFCGQECQHQKFMKDASKSAKIKPSWART